MPKPKKFKLKVTIHVQKPVDTKLSLRLYPDAKLECPPYQAYFQTTSSGSASLEESPLVGSSRRTKRQHVPPASTDLTQSGEDRPPQEAANAAGTVKNCMYIRKLVEQTFILKYRTTSRRTVCLKAGEIKAVPGFDTTLSSLPKLKVYKLNGRGCRCKVPPLPCQIKSKRRSLHLIVIIDLLFVLGC
jgi:hypothetical protein